MRHALRRVAVAGVVGALAWVGVSPLHAAADDQPPQTEAEQALQQAKDSGQQVEVVGQRTENTTTYANPDGFTFTLDQSTAPVRVEASGGGWTTPDATLQTRADGTVGPKAAAVDLAFSGGGSTTPLVSIARNGRSMAFTWPGTLPAPTLDGTTAVYADVLPDVDLRMTASVEGYHEVLVVKTPAAAADPKVKHIEFGMRTAGLDVRATSGGGLSALDGNGQELFASPPAQMWDSTGDGGTSQAAKTATRTSKSFDAPAPTAGPTVTADPSTAPAATTDAPAPGASVSTAPIAVGDDSVTLVPDAGLLSTTDPAAFPLYIDPDVALNSSAPERTLLRDDGYTDYGWGNGSDGRGEGDGHCGTWNGYYCGPGYTQRLYFQFTPGALKGKKVLSATFRVTSNWAFQCDPRWTDLVLTSRMYSSSTWSTRPRELDWMVDRYFSAGRGSSCDPDTPAAPIEFTDNPAESNENLTPTVQDFAAGKFATLTLELRAHDETDTSAWKRYKNNAELSVTYVGLPALPTGVGIATDSSSLCHTDYKDPQLVDDPTPLIEGRPQTAAGGEAGARLRTLWRVEKWDGSVWSPAIADITRPTSGFVGDNVLETASTGTLSDGVPYRLRAETLSYEDNQSTSINSGLSGWSCYFTIDSTAPKAPTVTFTSVYTECLPNACVPGGNPGRIGYVTFAGAAGDKIQGFQYKLSSNDTWTPATTAPTPIQPPAAGTYHLDVRAQDTLGRWGAETVKDFVVAPGAGPAGEWHFDEATGAALDTSTTDPAQQDNATLSASGATRDDLGRRGDLTTDSSGTETTAPDKGLHLNGTSGYAETPKSVIDARASYTVSAWARLDPSVTAGHTMTVVSQDGGVSPFFLSYDADNVDNWSFRFYSCHSTCVASKASSTIKPVPGAWTYLTGEYDADAKTISLYVNGVHQSTVAAGDVTEYDRPLEFGRATWGSPVDYFNGSIDEVKVWQRALTPEEIATEARMVDAGGQGQVELVGSWQADGQTGTAVTDTTSGYGRTLTLSGGASLEDRAIVLNGTDGYAGTPGQVVDSAGSFTITARAEIDAVAMAKKPINYVAQVAGQQSSDGSAWGIWFKLTSLDTTVDDDGNIVTVPVGQWLFGRIDAGGSFTGTASTPAELSAASGDGGTQVTGIFDAQSSQTTLYLGQIRKGDPVAYTSVAGTGDFTAGRASVNGVWGHYLPGRIDDIRLWAGAITDPSDIT